MVFMSPNWPQVFFSVIAPRPGMYIGMNEAQGVVLYVRGYQQACRHAGADDRQDFFDGLRDWLMERYKLEGDHGWSTAAQTAGITSATVLAAEVLLYMKENEIEAPLHDEATAAWITERVMSPNLKRYCGLEKRLLELREYSGSDDPPGVDAILDEMEEVWSLLSDAERKKWSAGPSRTFPSN